MNSDARSGDARSDSDMAPLRCPSRVMRLHRLGAFHQTRLSFMRVLLRRLHRDRWQISRAPWAIDQRGVGVAVYTARGPVRSYSLVAFSHELDPEMRSDRVIAEAWDATFVLFDGIPAQSDLDRLATQVPRQEAGRLSKSELSLSRANRSVRLFDYVRKCLARGQQPQLAELDKTGYLMRTTAVYGSGKFGACDRRDIADREEFTEPFQTELLSVLMIREFSTDIVEHLARADNPDQAVRLKQHLKRRIGIGNSTGLGMAPFLINHPTLFNHWIKARETALARVKSVRTAAPAEVDCFLDRLNRQIQQAHEWHTDHQAQAQKVAALTEDLKQLRARSHQSRWDDHPWRILCDWADTHVSLEAQECLVTLVLEPYPQLVDELSASMSIDEAKHFAIDGRMPLSELQGLTDQHYRFADDFQPDQREHNARFWYVSEEKLEPRLGERFEESGHEREFPLAVARDIAALKCSLESAVGREPGSCVAEFLLQYPQHRHTVRRVQQSVRHPYAEIADNLISADMQPIDLLRCKLSFFGAVKFDPKSDRWVRITMFQHAPTIDEIGKAEFTDDWVYPPVRQMH